MVIIKYYYVIEKFNWLFKKFNISSLVRNENGMEGGSDDEAKLFF